MSAKYRFVKTAFNVYGDGPSYRVIDHTGRSIGIVEKVEGSRKTMWRAIAPGHGKSTSYRWTRRDAVVSLESKLAMEVED